MARRFDFVVDLLSRELESLPGRARKDAAAKTVVQHQIQDLKAAIGLLRLAEKYQITPSAKIVELPQPKTLSPSSEVRVIEDHESDERGNWTEVIVEGSPVRPSPGDLMVKRGSKT